MEIPFSPAMEAAFAANLQEIQSKIEEGYAAEQRGELLTLE
jgi:hypothetical protein